MSDHGGPPTEPLRPAEVGTEPIPEHARRPLVSPAQRREPTVAGLPTKLVAVAAFVVLLFFVLGFLAGRALGGDPDEAAPASDAGGRAEAACGRAVSAALEMIEVQRAALANRTEFTEAAVTGDEGRMDELNEALGPLAEQVQQLEGRVSSAAAACEAGGGRKGGKGGKGGKRGKGGGGGDGG